MSFLTKIFGQTNYLKGARVVSSMMLLDTLEKRISFSGDLRRAQRELFFRDTHYLVLETKMLYSWVSKYHSSLGFWDAYAKERLDCDDFEYLFRADRIKGRWRCGWKQPEAVGGIDYLTQNGTYHRAAWAASVNLDKLEIHIYQPQKGTWNETDVVKTAVLIDA